MLKVSEELKNAEEERTNLERECLELKSKLKKFEIKSTNISEKRKS